MTADDRRVFADEIIRALTLPNPDNQLDYDDDVTTSAHKETLDWAIERIRTMAQADIPTEYQIEVARSRAATFTQIDFLEAGRRLGVQWTPWCGDWFNSWSPRNHNSNAEGTWSEWIELALRILRHPLTAAAHPHVYAAATAGLPHPRFLPRDIVLTDEQIMTHVIDDLRDEHHQENHGNDQ